jgi:hypothetical protein
VSEKAPEMSAWEAITVATLESPTSASVAAPAGTMEKNGFSAVDGSRRMRAPWPK